MIASGVLAITSQRLIRKVCPFCAEDKVLTRDEIRAFGFSEESVERFVKSQEVSVKVGRGCDHCKGTGYLGRTAVAEILRMDEEIGDMVVRGYPPLAIAQRAREKGMRTIKEDGLIKVLKGVTTPEEVRRVVG